METKKQAVPVYLEPEQIEWLEAMAKRHDRTKGYFIRQAVAAFKEEMEALQQQGAAR